MQRIEFMQTALDTTVDGRRVDLTLLIQDECGAIPGQFSGGGGSDGPPPDPEAARKKAGITLYDKIARSECEVRTRWRIILMTCGGLMCLLC